LEDLPRCACDDEYDEGGTRMPTAEQIALLHATVYCDFERAEELAHALGRSNRLDEYGEVIGAGFLLAVRMQFPQRWSAADVIRLVADTRVTFDRSGEVIDQKAAERVVRSALGQEELAERLPDAVVVETQIAVVSGLAHQRKLGDPERFMHEVQKLLDEWATDDEAAAGRG
jgi:hypothetical protein